MSDSIGRFPFSAVGGNGPAWIPVDPTNQYMYVANQGTSTVGVLAIDASGELILKYSVPTGRLRSIRLK
jgi:DNA-binding beta-propeller fold protein YncE